MNNSGDQGMIRIVVSVYDNREQKSIWATAFIKGELLDRWKRLNPSEGTGINLYGDFGVSLRQIQGKAPSIDLGITVRNFELVPAYGSGLCEVTITRCRIIKEVSSTERACFLSCAYDAYVRNEKRSNYIQLSCFGNQLSLARNMKLKKGSTIDVSAKYMHDVFITENGTAYLDLKGIVTNMSYSALPKKTEDGNQDENASQQQPAAQGQPQQPPQQMPQQQMQPQTPPQQPQQPSMPPMPPMQDMTMGAPYPQIPTDGIPENEFFD